MFTGPPCQSNVPVTRLVPLAVTLPVIVTPVAAPEKSLPARKVRLDASVSRKPAATPAVLPVTVLPPNVPSVPGAKKSVTRKAAEVEPSPATPLLPLTMLLVNSTDAPPPASAA